MIDTADTTADPDRAVPALFLSLSLFLFFSLSLFLSQPSLASILNAERRIFPPVRDGPPFVPA